MGLTFELGPSSATAVTLEPLWDYSYGQSQRRSETRGASGRLFLRRWSNTAKVKVPLEYVPASIANVVNSWWSTNTDLLWFVTSDTTTTVTSVTILNKESPFKTFSKPYETHFDGIVELEER